MDRIIITRAYSGGKDLFLGVPNIEGATVLEQKSVDNVDCYETHIVLAVKGYYKYTVVIKQDKER